MEIQFSIVIPNRKRIDELRRAIISLRDQTYQNWEAVIVDDDSPNVESIEDMISEFSDPRLRPVRNTPHGNAAVCRNIGIDSAQGAWICFLDSDDIFEPDKLAVFFQEIDENLDKKVAYYSQYYLEIEDKVKITPSREIHTDESISSYVFSNAGSIPTSGIVIRIEVARSIRFREWCLKYQDYDFLLRGEAEGVRFKFIRKPLWRKFYRQSNDNVGAVTNIPYSVKWFSHYKPYLSKESRLDFINRQIIGTTLGISRSERIAMIFAAFPRLLKEPVVLLLLLLSWVSFTAYSKVANKISNGPNF